MPITNLPRDVATRWNSTFDMLDYALQHRKAVDGITLDRDWGLRPCELDDTEWEMLDELRNVLKVWSQTCGVAVLTLRRNAAASHQILKDATEYFSRATPNLATVIPVMDAMDAKLREHARNDRLSRPIRAGITIALRTLNHYYSLTDSSEVYRIAMGA